MNLIIRSREEEETIQYFLCEILVYGYQLKHVLMYYIYINIFFLEDNKHKQTNNQTNYIQTLNALC